MSKENQKTSEEESHEEIEQLRGRVQEAEELVDAIRYGSVDAFLVQGPTGERAWTLRSADHVFRLMIERMQEGALTLSADRTVLYCNRAFSDLVKCDPKDIIGHDISETCILGENVSFESFLTVTEDVRGEYTLILKGGDKIPVNISATSIVEDEQRIWSLIFTDLTHQRHHEKLKQANRELETFAYAASHDLQAPLRSVKGYVQLLERSLAGKLDEEDQELIEGAVSGVDHMYQLINDLLTFSRIQEPKLQPVPVAQIVDKVRNELRQQIEKAGARVDYDELPIVMADVSLLPQLFQNFFTNALKFSSDEAPVITIRANDLGDYQEIEVADNGIGFDPQYAERIFDMFKRLHSQSRFPGTGIGLALCRKIIERHGGTIRAESKPGEGASFFFTLPKAIV